MKLGIAGGGAIVREFLEHIASTVPHLSVTALFARRHEVREELSSAYNIPNAFSSYEEMLAFEEIDTVYVAVPNHLHYAFAKNALLSGKHVILEKPFTVTYREAEELFAIAEGKGLSLFEAISTGYHPNLFRLQDALSSIGEITSAVINFSQYSRRYEDFQRGILHPVFDPAQAGGAQMDLGVYNLHLALRLFGMPEKAEYIPVLEKGIDVAGETILTYPSFTVRSICAKNQQESTGLLIEGTEGTIESPGTPNELKKIIIHKKTGESQGIYEPAHRLSYEWQAFPAFIEQKDTHAMEMAKEYTLNVMKILSKE